MDWELLWSTRTEWNQKWMFLYIVIISNVCAKSVTHFIPFFLLSSPSTLVSRGLERVDKELFNTKWMSPHDKQLNSVLSCCIFPLATPHIMLSLFVQSLPQKVRNRLTVMSPALYCIVFPIMRYFLEWLTCFPIMERCSRANVTWHFD